MTDLRARFRTIDALEAPHLWTEVEARSVAADRFAGNRFGLALVAAAALLAATLGAQLLIGSGPPTTPASPSLSPASPPPRGTWVPTGAMHEGRFGHTATLLPSGLVLIVGGMSGAAGQSRASAELYDPSTGTWTATGQMHQGRARHTATLLRDNTVLVTGGVGFTGGNGNDVELASTELFDPSTGTWSVKPGLGEARSGHTAVLLTNGRVLIAGGWGSTERFGPKLETAQLYDPVTASWSATGRMTEARDGIAGTLLQDGTVLVPGGYDTDRLATAEVYDPSTGSWTAAGGLQEPFLGYTAVRLNDGTVLIAGGDVPSGPGARGSAHAALFDPVSAAWRFTGRMVVTRLGHAGTLLPDGRVLVTGGKVFGGPDSSPFASAEVYDPATGAWTAVADMTIARSAHAVTLLPDGRVLVTGGEAAGGSPLDSAELYVP